MEITYKKAVGKEEAGGWGRAEDRAQFSEVQERKKIQLVRLEEGARDKGKQRSFHPALPIKTIFQDNTVVDEEEFPVFFFLPPSLPPFPPRSLSLSSAPPAAYGRSQARG